MKKERLTDDESELISSVSAISFNHIINNINTSLKKVNKTFNLNISCSINNPEPVESSRLDSEKQTQTPEEPTQTPEEPAQEAKKPEDKETKDGEE